MPSDTKRTVEDRIKLETAATLGHTMANDLSARQHPSFSPLAIITHWNKTEWIAKFHHSYIPMNIRIYIHTSKQLVEWVIIMRTNEYTKRLNFYDSLPVIHTMKDQTVVKFKMAVFSEIGSFTAKMLRGIPLLSSYVKFLYWRTKAAGFLKALAPTGRFHFVYYIINIIYAHLYICI